MIGISIILKYCILIGFVIIALTAVMVVCGWVMQVWHSWIVGTIEWFRKKRKKRKEYM